MSFVFVSISQHVSTTVIFVRLVSKTDFPLFSFSASLLFASFNFFGLIAMAGLQTAGVLVFHSEILRLWSCYFGSETTILGCVLFDRFGCRHVKSNSSQLRLSTRRVTLGIPALFYLCKLSSCSSKENRVTDTQLYQNSEEFQSNSPCWEEKHYWCDVRTQLVQGARMRVLIES